MYDLMAPVHTTSTEKQLHAVISGQSGSMEHTARHAIHAVWLVQLHLSCMIILLKATELWVERGLERFGRADGPDFAPLEIEDALLV